VTGRKRSRRQRLGQHFLAPAWASRLIDAIAPRPGDVFLEIGPGSGALTLPLAATGVPILAVDLDRRLVDDLARRVPSNVTVMHGDMLTTDVVPFLTGLVPSGGPGAGALPRRFRVAGNLPYSVASPLLFRLVESYRRDRLFADATVMLQREVADRLLARPGTKTYGGLTLLIGAYATPVRLLDLPPGAFSPPPKVKSTVLQLTFHDPVARIVDERLFERLVKQMFGHRRKTLGNALKGFSPSIEGVLAASGLNLRRRPETLELAEIAALVERLASAARGAVL
jgi:16S rRNA (adenine1518-N6/adenine1519-N6)-dimethyltransferase